MGSPYLGGHIAWPLGPFPQLDTPTSAVGVRQGEVCLGHGTLRGLATAWEEVPGEGPAWGVGLTEQAGFGEQRCPLPPIHFVLFSLNTRIKH